MTRSATHEPDKDQLTELSWANSRGAYTVEIEHARAVCKHLSVTDVLTEYEIDLSTHDGWRQLLRLLHSELSR